MLIKIKDSPKTQAEKRANHWYSQEGQAQRQDAVELQKDMQGGLSDMVREHGALEDGQIQDFFDDLHNRSPSEPVSRKSSAITTYVYPKV